MSKTSDKTDTEASALFRAAMADVTPLAQQDTAVQHDRPSPPPRRLRHTAREALPDDLFSDEAPPGEEILADDWLFLRPGLQHSVVRKLRRGQYPIDADLDMHGLRVAEARQILTQFLHQAIASGCRVVRIIHGKGQGSANRQPVLKGRVRHWLQQRAEVLACCACRAEHGGGGAIYVLLRRANRSD